MHEWFALAVFAADQVGDAFRDLGPWANAGVLGMLAWLLVWRDRSYQESVQKLVDSFKADRSLDRESQERQTNTLAGIMNRNLELFGSCVKALERVEMMLSQYGSGHDLPTRHSRANPK